MPAPYTAFTYGDPTRNTPVINEGSIWLPSLLGLTFNNGVLGQAYAQQFTPAGYGGLSFIANNAAPISPGGVTVAVTSGSLPTGLSLSYVSGLGTWQISGTPTAAGTFTFSLTATGYYGAGVAVSFTITIAAIGYAYCFAE